MITGENIAEIALTVDQIPFVGKIHQCGKNRGVAMGMELHGFADDVGDLMETAVIHIVQGLQYAALNRFKTIVKMSGIARSLNDIGGVFEEILVEELV